MFKKKSILDIYPQYKTLLGLVPTKIIEREISKSAKIFEDYFPKAEKKIRTVRLADIFPIEMEKGVITLENFLGHWGNMTVEEICKIALIVKFLHPEKIFEFGTYNGLTTLQMALNTPKSSTVYTLDLPEKGTTPSSLSVLDNYVVNHFRKKLGTETGSYFKKRRDVKIIQLFGDSAKFNFSKFIGNIDLIFIDAAHDYYHKKLDSENSFRMLGSSGVIIWHNYGDVGNPDVTKYLSELANKIRLFHLRGTQFVVYRKQS